MLQAFGARNIDSVVDLPNVIRFEARTAVDQVIANSAGNSHHSPSLTDQGATFPAAIRAIILAKAMQDPDTGWYAQNEIQQHHHIDRLETMCNDRIVALSTTMPVQQPKCFETQPLGRSAAQVEIHRACRPAFRLARFWSATQKYGRHLVGLRR